MVGKLAAFSLKYFHYTNDYVTCSKIKPFKQSFCLATNTLDRIKYQFCLLQISELTQL